MAVTFTVSNVRRTEGDVAVIVTADVAVTGTVTAGGDLISANLFGLSRIDALYFAGAYGDEYSGGAAVPYAANQQTDGTVNIVFGCETGGAAAGQKNFAQATGLNVASNLALTTVQHCVAIGLP